MAQNTATHVQPNVIPSGYGGKPYSLGLAVRNILFLIFIPLIVCSVLAAHFVGILGIAIPYAAEHLGQAWMMSEWFHGLIMFVLIILLVVMPFASLLTWAERRESAMMQDRVGPNRAAIAGFKAWGILHFVTDAMKMIFKEDFVPAKANKWLFTLAPFLAIVPVFIIFAVIPFGGDMCAGHMMEVIKDPAACSTKVTLQVARLDVGLLFYFAIASLAVYGTTLAGWASYNKWSLLGGMRASSQMMSYEVTMGMAVLGSFICYSTLEPFGMANAQGANPLHWGIILQPLGALLFFVASVAETKRAPFDLPEGEAEVVGYFVEYSGMRFGTFFLAEFIEVVFVGALMSTVFFGGFHMPFLDPDGVRIGGFYLPMWHGIVVFTQCTFFIFKIVFFCWFQLLIRWTYPRFRPDQLMNLGWKQMLPASILNIILTAAVVLAMQACASHP